MYSAVDVLERRDASAEEMAKVVVSEEEMADGSLAAKTGNAEDSAVVTETAETIPVTETTADAAEVITVKTEESGVTETGKQRIVSLPGTERREKQENERRRKSLASATAFPKERDPDKN